MADEPADAVLSAFSLSGRACRSPAFTAMAVWRHRRYGEECTMMLYRGDESKDAFEDAELVESSPVGDWLVWGLIPVNSAASRRLAMRVPRARDCSQPPYDSGGS